MITKPTLIPTPGLGLELSDAALASVGGGKSHLHGTYGVDRTKHGRDEVSETGYYNVGRGDNLTRIAEATNQSVDSLLDRNPSLKSHPNLINPGDRIITGSSTHDV